jgi:hypothetical protein
MTIPLKTIFSRILLVVAAGAVIAFAYLFVQVSLAPVAVPPAPPTQKSISFNPQLDVTKQPAFEKLRPLGVVTFEPMELGRPNPFISPQSEVTSTPSESAEMTTTTPPTP